MKNFICKICNKEFVGYGNRKTCSQTCKSKYYQQKLKGKNNPNYKHGKHFEENRCKTCNILIDYRASKCKQCAGLLSIITKEEIEEAAKETTSYVLMGQFLNISRQTAKSLVEKFNIDISHFRPSRGRKLGIKDILTNGTKARNATVFHCILDNNLLLKECAKCKLKDKWNGRPIRLNLHHINGNNKDNRIENLQILCPNCHSQTDNFTGRNRKK